MTDATLVARAKILIEPPDADVAQKSLARVLERDADGALGAVLDAEPRARTLLLGALACSPYLTELSARDPARLARVLTNAPEASIAALVEASRAPASDETALMRGLRLVKQEAALVIGLADLAKAWGTMEATEALTEIADATLSAAVAFTLREASLKGQLELADQRSPQRGCGWIFLGMGKQGAGELNYSSDIDLVVFFDRARVRVTRPDEDTDLFVKLTKRVVRIMSERTGDGYVFRVDLRLRPDPGSTAVAVSLDAARHYYETLGQNWERAAFIKARPVAGDIALGDEFSGGAFAVHLAQIFRLTPPSPTCMR